MRPEELGYYLHPSHHPDDPGHPELEINIVDAPEHLHYDTRQVTFTIAYFGGVSKLDIRHPWHSSHYHVCAGPIMLLDFVDKPVEMFSFGGEMIVTEGAMSTHCRLKSSAPILWVTDESTTATVLSEEFISLLARRHAAWAGQPAEYEARLSKADPLQLYIASLNQIRHMCEHMPRGCNEVLHHATLAAIHTLETDGKWPLYVHTLEEVL
jgi:hypothetical protein